MHTYTYNNINFGLFIIIILYYNTNCLLFHRAKVFIAHHTHHFLYRGKSRHTHLGGGTFWYDTIGADPFESVE